MARTLKGKSKAFTATRATAATANGASGSLTLMRRPKEIARFQRRS